MIQTDRKNETKATNQQPRKLFKFTTIIQAILGAASVIIAIVLAIMTWSALIAGHPAYLILLSVIFIVGVILLIQCMRPRKAGKLRTVGRILGTVVLVPILAATIYLRPCLPHAAGISAAKSTESIEVIEHWDSWELRPTGETNNVGIVFLPGMLVDSRAYLPLLTPMVEQGAVLVVPKAALGMIMDGTQVAEKAIQANPNIDTWIVGGHSMGGAVASSVAESVSAIDGLMIWASFSMMDMSDSDVAVISIYGTNDPFADEKMVSDARGYLPDGTSYIAIEGGIHEHFGDYTQPGDGTPGIDRASAEQQIIQATLAFVDSLK